MNAPKRRPVNSARIFSMFLAGAVAATLALGGCSKSSDTSASSDAPPVKIEIVTSEGTIDATLDAAHAPKTVANFLHYTDTKFYNGGTFFRAIPGFVIQGGNKGKEASSSAKPIELEDPQTTGLKNVAGALAMARTNDPNSATSEFFIDLAPETFLDGDSSRPGYAVFGNVTSGMDVAQKIVSGLKQAPPGQEMLAKPVTIVSIARVKP